ncbi:hypothetical protein ACIQUQ_31315 [Streptomyces sp. NPDC101118]|uniref:hypothetical protein n=1 Tax=Streptomyces sp. NPDC101118 TaxID=3366109 RepID=UPI00380D7D31
MFRHAFPDATSAHADAPKAALHAHGAPTASPVPAPAAAVAAATAAWPFDGARR